MKNLDLKNAPPILTNWIIKYDDLFEMPQYLQGKLVNNYGEFEAKSNILLDNLLGLDLGKTPKVYTTDGEVFLLAGKGQRMFLVENEPPIKWLYDEVKETDEFYND